MHLPIRRLAPEHCLFCLADLQGPVCVRCQADAPLPAPLLEVLVAEAEQCETVWALLSLLDLLLRRDEHWAQRAATMRQRLAQTTLPPAPQRLLAAADGHWQQLRSMGAEAPIPAVFATVRRRCQEELQGDAAPLRRRLLLELLVKWLQHMVHLRQPDAWWGAVMFRGAVEEYSQAGRWLDSEEREAVALGDALLERNGPAIAERCRAGLEGHLFGYQGWAVDFLTRHLQANTEFLPKKLQREREQLRLRNELRGLIVAYVGARCAARSLWHRRDDATRARAELVRLLAPGPPLSHSLRRLLRRTDPALLTIPRGSDTA